MSTPPSNGPATDAMPNMLPMKPMYMGLLWSGIVYMIMRTAPLFVWSAFECSDDIVIVIHLKMPDEPNPPIALPMMKVVDVGAAPHIADPTAKMDIATR